MAVSHCVIPLPLCKPFQISEFSRLQDAQWIQLGATPATPLIARCSIPRDLYDVESMRSTWHGSLAWIECEGSVPIALQGEKLDTWSMREPHWDICEGYLKCAFIVGIIVGIGASNIDGAVQLSAASDHGNQLTVAIEFGLL